MEQALSSTPTDDSILVQILECGFGSMGVATKPMLTLTAYHPDTQHLYYMSFQLEEVAEVMDKAGCLYDLREFERKWVWIEPSDGEVRITGFYRPPLHFRGFGDAMLAEPNEIIHSSDPTGGF